MKCLMKKLGVLIPTAIVLALAFAFSGEPRGTTGGRISLSAGDGDAIDDRPTAPQQRLSQTRVAEGQMATAMRGAFQDFGPVVTRLGASRLELLEIAARAEAGPDEIAAAVDDYRTAIAEVRKKLDDLERQAGPEVAGPMAGMIAYYGIQMSMSAGAGRGFLFEVGGVERFTKQMQPSY